MADRKPVMANPIEDMDITSDLFESEICVITCPYSYCNKRFLLPIVFNTHLLGHINFYHREWQGLFACTICEFEHGDMAEVSAHVKNSHAIKHMVDPHTANQILIDDNREKSQIVVLLSRSDKPANPLYIPFNYWD